MRWRLLVPLLTIMLLLFPGVALAQESTPSTDDLLLHVNGPTTVPAEQVVGTVVVIRGDAVVHGVIKHGLLVVDGNATVTGTVEGSVMVVRGTLNLSSTAHVNGDVNLANSSLTREPGSTVEGTVNSGSYTWSGWQLLLFSIYLWISVTIALVVAALIFAAVGGRTLMAAGELMIRQVGQSIVAALVVGIGIPVLAIVAMVTVLGIPLGLGLLLFLIPALWFFGYLTAGTRLGVTILRQQSNQRPYLAAVIGVLLLQAISLVPFLGGAVAFLAGIYGTGALVLLAWNTWRGPSAGTPAAQTRTIEPAPGD